MVKADSRSKADGDDLLYAIRKDGNIVSDSHIRQEFGMIFSDKFGWAVRMDTLVHLMEYIRRDAPPVTKKVSFMLAAEPESPQNDSYITNVLLPTAYRGMRQGTTKEQVNRKRITQRLRVLFVTATAAVVLAAFVVIPMMKQPQIVPIPDSILENVIQEREVQLLEQLGVPQEKIDELTSEDNPGDYLIVTPTPEAASAPVGEP